MKLKRLLSVLLTFAMVMTMGVPGAFAQDPGASGGTPTDIKPTLVVRHVDQDTQQLLESENKGEQTLGDTVSVSAKTIFGYNLVVSGTQNIQIQKGENVATFYYTKRTDMRYTVRYLEQGTDASVHPEKTVNGQTFKASVTETAPDIEGYMHAGATSMEVTVDADNKTVAFYYVKRTDLSYTIKYVDQATGASVAEDDVVGGQTYDTDVTVDAKDITGYYKVEPSQQKVHITTGVNEVTFQYAIRTDMSYIVRYLEQGTNTPLYQEKTVNGQTFKASVTETAPDIEGYMHAGATSMEVTVDEDNKTVAFYYVKRTDLSYTVKYLEADTGIELEPMLTVDGQTFQDNVAVKAQDIYGYVADEASKNVVIGLTGNEVTFYYAKRTDLSYTVKYLEADTGVELAETLTVTNQTFQATVTENAKEITGYVVDQASKSIEIDVAGNEIVFYYTKRADLQYTVNYYWNGTQEKVQPSDLFEDQVYLSEISLLPPAIEGYTPVNAQKAETITVLVEGVEVEQNAINFYYYKNVTLTANSNKEAVYNGETQQVEGYTTSADTAAAKVAFEGLTATAEGVNYAAEGYMVLFNIENPVGLVDVTQKYIVTQANAGLLMINKRPVKVTVSATKPFGSVDPEKALWNVAFEQAAGNSGLLPQDTIDFPAEDLNLLARVQGEQPGAYAIDGTGFQQALNLLEGNANYAIAFDAVNSLFEITSTPAFDICLAELDSHHPSVSFAITGENLIPTLPAEMVLTAVVTAPESAFIPSDMPVEPLAADWETNQFHIGGLNYAKDTFAWVSGLPAGTVLTLHATFLDGVAIQFAVTEGKAQTVSAVEDGLKISLAENTPNNGVADLLSETGKITISADETYVAYNDVVVVKIGAAEKAFTYAEIKGEQSFADLYASVTGDQSGLLVDKQDWCNKNPQGFVDVAVTMLDNVNHKHEGDEHAKKIAVDNGAVDGGSIAIRNRQRNAHGATVLATQDSVGNKPIEPLGYGSAQLSFIPQAGPSGTGENAGSVTLDFGSWENNPANLPRTGSFDVTYYDLVGHPVKTNVTIGRSGATVNATLYVKPMTDRTVPSGRLVFYGQAHDWEALTLTVGGRRYAIDPLQGTETYTDTGMSEWQYVVDLADIDFPVGEPTYISITYNNLSGGGDSVTLTYKDHAYAPAMAGPLVVGSDAVYGYVESGATVRMTIVNGATSTPVSADKIVVDKSGYFYANLDNEFKQGDVVQITVEDFCGNVSTWNYNVLEEMPKGETAQVLGMNVTGELADGTYAHRYVLPVHLSAFNEDANAVMELPILAYKSIEIGTAKIQLNGNKLTLSYELTTPDFIPVEGAQARVSVYNAQPDFAMLMDSQHATAQADLSGNLTGTLCEIDVSSYRLEDGSFNGTLWIYTEFDMEMDARSYSNRGGRGVNFYRWIQEDAQTETLLNAKYDQTSTYEQNNAYYGMYQAFGVTEEE